MSLSAEQKKAIVTKFQRDPSDTGSPEVQIAILTESINKLTAHMKENLKDFHSRRGLLRQVSRRRKLLDYLKKQNSAKYSQLIIELNIRK